MITWNIIYEHPSKSETLNSNMKATPKTIPNHSSYTNIYINLVGWRIRKFDMLSRPTWFHAYLIKIWNTKSSAGCWSWQPFTRSHNKTPSMSLIDEGFRSLSSNTALTTLQSKQRMTDQPTANNKKSISPQVNTTGQNRSLTSHPTQLSQCCSLPTILQPLL